MGFYKDRVVPRIADASCGRKTMRQWREWACEGLKGDVIEIGFGSGLNIPFYPPEVQRVAAIEPAETAWKLAGKQLSSTTVPIQWSGLDGQSLPFPAATYDAALSTWTLCTIPDVMAALGELRRVLKPGGTLHFVEHGLAPDESVRRWQRRLEPMNKRLLGGCRLTRPIVGLLNDAGFDVTDVQVFYATGAPKFAGAFSMGVATTA